MIVDSVMRRTLATVAPEATVHQAALVMRQHGVGSVVVVRAGEPVGILTERDLAYRIVAEGRDAAHTLTRDVMSAPLITIEASASLEEAAEKMRALHIKRLVVVVGAELRGVVTVTDIAYARPDLTKRFMDGWVKPRWED